MTTLIDKYFATADTDEIVRTALVDRYQALEGRTELLKRLRPGLLSNRLQRHLIEPRNDATHGGHSLTFEQAQTAVDMATDIVQEAHPLASLPEQLDDFRLCHYMSSRIIARFERLSCLPGLLTTSRIGHVPAKPAVHQRVSCADSWYCVRLA